jgi:hypothetical protein
LIIKCGLRNGTNFFFSATLPSSLGDIGYFTFRSKLLNVFNNKKFNFRFLQTFL